MPFPVERTLKASRVMYIIHLDIPLGMIIDALIYTTCGYPVPGLDRVLKLSDFRTSRTSEDIRFDMSAPALKTHAGAFRPDRSCKDNNFFEKGKSFSGRLRLRAVRATPDKTFRYRFRSKSRVNDG